MKSGSMKYSSATSNREMKPSIASRRPQEHGSVQQSHVGLLLGLTAQRNAANDRKEEGYSDRANNEHRDRALYFHLKIT